MGSRFLFSSVAFIFLAFTLICCKNGSKTEPAKQTEQVEKSYPSVSAYEFAKKQKEEGADTIIYYKRTCINCCDFYNVFWVKDGIHHLNKFYWQVVDSSYRGITSVMKTEEVNLLNDSVFIVLAANYSRLKSDSITPVFTAIDHYCYTEFTIYTKGDSVAERMEDYDFSEPWIPDNLKGVEWEAEARKNKRIYKANRKSAWAKLQISVEREIMYSPETSIEEQKRQRTFYDKK